MGEVEVKETPGKKNYIFDDVKVKETPGKKNYTFDNVKLPKILFFNFDKEKIKLSKKEFKEIFLNCLCNHEYNSLVPEKTPEEKKEIKKLLGKLSIKFCEIESKIKQNETKQQLYKPGAEILKEYFYGNNRIYINSISAYENFKYNLKDCAKSNLRWREYLISTLKSTNTSKTKKFNSEIKGLLNTEILEKINNTESLQEKENKNDSKPNTHNIIYEEVDINNTTEQILKNIFENLKIRDNKEEKEKIINKYQKSIDNLIEILYNFDPCSSFYCWNQEVSRKIIQKINTLKVEEWKDNLNLDKNAEEFFNKTFNEICCYNNNDKELYSEYRDCLVSISSLFQMIGTKSDDFKNNYKKVKNFINKNTIPEDTSLINLYYETKVNEKGREKFFNKALEEIEKFKTNNLKEEDKSLKTCLVFCSDPKNKKNKKELLDLIKKEKLSKENLKNKEKIYENAKKLEIKNELSDIKEYLNKHNLSDKRLQSFITNFFNNGDKESTIDILKYYIEKENYDKALKYFSNFAGKNMLYFSFIDSLLSEKNEKTEENKEIKEKAENNSKGNNEEENDKFHNHHESKKSDKDNEVKQKGEHHHSHNHKKVKHDHEKSKGKSTSTKSKSDKSEKKRKHHHEKSKGKSTDTKKEIKSKDDKLEKKYKDNYSHYHKHHKKSSKAVKEEKTNQNENQEEIIYELKPTTKQGETQTSPMLFDAINAVISLNNKNEELKLVKTPLKIKKKEGEKNGFFIYQEREIQSETANTQSRCPCTPKTKVCETPVKNLFSLLDTPDTPAEKTPLPEKKCKDRTEDKDSIPTLNFDNSNNYDKLDSKSEKQITTRSESTTTSVDESKVQNKKTSGPTRSNTIPIAENIAKNNDDLKSNSGIQKIKSAMPSTSLEKGPIEEIKKEIVEKIGDFFSKNSNNNKKEYNEKASEIRKDIATIVKEETKEQNLTDKENETIEEIYTNFNNKENREDNLQKLLNNDYGKKLLNTEKRFTIEHFNEKYKNNGKQCKVKTQMDENGITLLIEDYYENEIIIAKSNRASPMEILSEVAKYVINNNYDKNNDITIEKKEIKKEDSLFQEAKQQKPQSENKKQNDLFKTQGLNKVVSFESKPFEAQEMMA